MKNNKGFTLIEAVIFIIVASVGFLILSAGYTSVIQKSLTGEYYSIAGALCEGRMEETIAAYTFDSIANNSGAFAAPFDTYTYQVEWFYVDTSDLNTEAGATTDYKNVRVTVSHSDSDIEPVYMTTLFVDY